MIGQTFLYTTYHFMPFRVMHATYAHQDIKWNTFSQICFLGISMGDRLKARISTIENIQEEFGHDIREVKEHLARLTSLFEDYIKTQTVLPRGLSPMPTQYASCLSPRPFIPTTNHLPQGIDCLNLRQPMPTAPPAFMETSRSVNQPNSSRSNLSG